LTNLYLLYLDHNHLTGDIPVELTQLVNILNWVPNWGNINLQFNYLNIPAATPELRDFLVKKDPDWDRTQVTFSLYAPANLTTYEFDLDSVTFTWEPIPDQYFFNGYRIYRDRQLLATLDRTKTAYKDRTAVCGTTYTYEVRGYMTISDMESIPSNPITVTTYDCVPFTCSSVTEIPQSECEALVALYNSTGGPMWTDNPGWLQTTTPCSWYGIGCKSGHISTIDLSWNQLNGSIPPELGNLSNLIRLFLQYNQLSGNIPPQLGNLTNLQYLWLYRNQLSGSIPPQLGNLTNLEVLNLHNNQLTGSIPAELGSLTNLTQLFLLGNHLSGSIPPQLGNLVDLRDLGLGHNFLSGDVPESFTQLVNLFDDVGLDLGYNQLTTAASSQQLADFLVLKDPDWTTTQSPPPPGFCDSVTEIPQSECEALVVLYNSTDGSTWTNNTGWLQTITPCFWNGISCDNGHINSIQLSSNNLSGNIPPELGNLTKLEHLYLFSNHLSGCIPAELGNLINLEYLNLWANHLSGSIPYQLGNLTNLYSLFLGINQLNGSIPPDLGNLTKLQNLVLETNQLSGNVPQELGNLVNLEGLINLDYNMLKADDPTTSAFLNAKAPGWDQTQTVPPANLVVTQLDADSALLTWTPILYSADGGYYVIEYSTTPGGPYTQTGTTPDKTISTYQVDNLIPATNYYFIVLSFTPAHHSGFQQNDLLSFPSNEAAVTILLSQVTAPIDPATGGTLEAQGNGTTTTIDAPPGAVLPPPAGQTFNLIYTPITPPATAPTGYQFAGQSFSLQAKLNETIEDHYTFLQPLTVTIQYTDAAISGLDESTVNLYFWDEIAQVWAPASSTCTPEGQVTRDPVLNTLEVQICHFSEFTTAGWPVDQPLPQPPAVTVNSITAIDEGGSISASGSFSDAAGIAWTGTVNYDDGMGVQPLALNSNKTFALQHAYPESGMYPLKVTITNNLGFSSEATLQVTVNNVIPQNITISAPVVPLAVNTPITTSASFTDPGLGDTFTATWVWGDGSSSTSGVGVNGRTVSGAHTYATAGVYTLELHITDRHGGTAVGFYNYVVIYDPEAGKVTGSGWITSPRGAYLSNPGLTGKAEFGFNSKYKRDANAPSGETEFNLKGTDFKFKSDDYIWLVIIDSWSEFRGTGTINKKGNYGFFISMIDGGKPHGPDYFRIKIWDLASGADIYDTQPGAPDNANPTTPLGDGKIKIQ